MHHRKATRRLKVQAWPRNNPATFGGRHFGEAQRPPFAVPMESRVFKRQQSNSPDFMRISRPHRCAGFFCRAPVELRECCRRTVGQCAVRPIVMVMFAELRQFLPSVVERNKPFHVQALVPLLGVQPVDAFHVLLSNLPAVTTRSNAGTRSARGSPPSRTSAAATRHRSAALSSCTARSTNQSSSASPLEAARPGTFCWPPLPQLPSQTRLELF